MTSSLLEMYTAPFRQKNFSHSCLRRVWFSPGKKDLSQIPFGSRHRLGQGFAKKLHKLAAQAPRQELPKLSRLLIETTARRILELDALIDEMDQAIEEWLPRVAPSQLLTTIPGIAAVSAAGILAEVGDVRRFKTKADFVGYCGLYPIVWESGEAKRRYRMTSKGNRMLKMTLLVASAAARQYNPLIAAFYERLRRRGKSKKAAGGAIARKLAELVYTLLVRGEAWSAEKAMEGMQELNENKEEASDSMCTFLALTLSGLTLMPTSVLAIRAQAGSRNPAEVVGPIILVTSLCTVAALLADRIFQRISPSRRRRL